MLNFNQINICPFCKKQLEYIPYHQDKRCTNSLCPHLFNLGWNPFVVANDKKYVGDIAYHFIKNKKCVILHVSYKKNFTQVHLSNGHDSADRICYLDFPLEINDPYDIKSIEEVLDNLILFG
jgi:hypothetical protein